MVRQLLDPTITVTRATVVVLSVESSEVEINSYYDPQQTIN